MCGQSYVCVHVHRKQSLSGVCATKKTENGFAVSVFAHSNAADVWIPAEKCRDYEEHARACQSVRRGCVDAGHVARDDEGLLEIIQ